MPNSTAVIKRAEEIVPREPISSVAVFSEKLLELRQHDAAFVLTPITSLDEIPPLHRVVMRVVHLNPDPNKREVYQSRLFCKSDEVALSKTGLMKILGVAGADTLTHRLDDRKDPYYAEFAALVYNQDLDGINRTYTGHKAVDLREGAPRRVNMKADEFKMASQFIAENAETKAVLRATRALFGLEHVYKIADLQRKPFVIVKLVQHWNMEDPDQKAAAIQQQLAATSRLYGASPGTPPMLGAAPAAMPAPALAERVPPDPRLLETGPASKEPDHVFDEELPDFDNKPGLVVCGCPCDCQAEITRDVHAKTLEKLGTPRCAVCFPGSRFDYGRHKGLKDLCFPVAKRVVTADEVRDDLAKRAKK